ncbi:DUF5677 domain-containing protein [Turneriella parva]|nr:DUF5677 domain-containing protein [Turneriella parva]
MSILTNDGNYDPEGVFELFKKFDLGLRGLDPGGKFHVEICSQFYVKYLVQFRTLIDFTRGQKIRLENEEYLIYDSYSSLSISRALLENFLNFAYIYTTPKSEPETVFRFNCWHLKGLIEQVSTVEYRPNMRDNHGKSIAATEAKIANLVAELSADPIFKALPEDRKKRILNGKGWQVMKRTEIAQAAGINASVLKTYFIHASAYAHTDSISLLQNYKAGMKRHKDLADHASTFIAMITVKFLWDLIGLFPTAKMHFPDTELAHIRVSAEQLARVR